MGPMYNMVGSLKTPANGGFGVDFGGFHDNLCMSTSAPPFCKMSTPIDIDSYTGPTIMGCEGNV